MLEYVNNFRRNLLENMDESNDVSCSASKRESSKSIRIAILLLLLPFAVRIGNCLWLERPQTGLPASSL